MKDGLSLEDLEDFLNNIYKSRENSTRNVVATGGVMFHKMLNAEVRRIACYDVLESINLNKFENDEKEKLICLIEADEFALFDALIIPIQNRKL
jgi:hypothetical protein